MLFALLRRRVFQSRFITLRLSDRVDVTGVTFACLFGQWLSIGELSPHPLNRVADELTERAVMIAYSNGEIGISFAF
jgi:hypothetical protein